MPLEAGQSLAHYRIDHKLGEGGMGEVWAATDTRLNRAAAIKTLPPAVVADPDRLARFKREAKVLAALSHPNIAAIYGLEQVGDAPYLVMELIDGDDLSARIANRPVPVDEAVEMALQIAAALEAAHDKGIVHRDLKPANIKVGRDGTVKVLDFGLAKAMEPDSGPGTQDPSNSPTLTAMVGTEAGLILGTAGYMSPEQARGKSVDRRADIWAFGVVLFEMLTGERLFGGETVTDVIAALVTREPDWHRLPAGVSSATRRLLRRCLEKDPRKRLRDIGDAILELREETVDGLSETIAPAPASNGRRAWLIGAAGLALGLASAMAIQAVLHPGDAILPTWLNLTPSPASAYDFTALLEISPDGRRVVFVASGADGAEPQLWVRDLATEQARPLPGTEGAQQPFWSPDSRSIGYFAARKLRRVSAAGGAPTAVADAGLQPRGGCWTEDGTILFVPDWSQPVFRVPESGGTIQAVTTFDAARFDTSHRWPHMLPDGQHFLFFIVSTYPDVNPENPSELDKSGLYIGSLDGSAPRFLQAARSRAVYSRGSLLFVDNNVLMARPFDPASLSFQGEAVTIAEGVTQSADALWGGALFSVSDEGTLLFVRGAPERRAASQLRWRDRQGNDLGTLGGPEDFTSIRLSHDGRRLAASIGDPADIWLYDLARGTSGRFTFDPGNDELPVWSPDDRYILFQSNRIDPGRTWSPANLYQKAESSLEPEEFLVGYDLGSAFFPTDWSPDRKSVVSTGVVPETGAALMVFSTDDRTIEPLPVADIDDQAARFSHDGNWLVYESYQSLNSEVFVRAFPGAGGKWQVSTAGGSLPIWSADGTELFYVGPEGMMAVAVSFNDGFQYGTPVKLFTADLGIPQGGGYYNYDVTPDGRRFLLLESVHGAAGPAATVTVLQGWRALLEPGTR